MSAHGILERHALTAFLLVLVIVALYCFKTQGAKIWAPLADLTEVTP